MKHRLRIAVVAACPFPAARGTPVRILRLAEALAARGHELHVAAYHLGDPRAAEGIRIHRIREVATYRKTSPGPSPQKLLVLDPLLVLLLRKVLREQPIDLVHAHHYEGLLVARLAGVRGRIPLVYDAHTLLESELPYYGGPFASLKKRVGRWLDRRVPPSADHVIAVAPRIRERLIRDGIVRGENITVVSNGVELELFEEARNRARPPSRVRRLVFTGNLALYQRIDLLLDVFARVAAVRADVRLLLVTNSPFDPYEESARRLGIRDRVDLVQAPFAEIPSLLAGADLALNPRTECDGIPQKVLNYMAAGRPIVSFEGSAVSVEHERTGLVVPNGDVEAFAAAVLRVLEDPALARRLGDAAAARAAEHSWAAKAEETEAIYRRLLERSRP
ncbi:MAG: glycosyltransferase family 4 protein [Candidatus Eisenbacteria bacterium]|nr:glycosyltransferase family 4 protein [Candidatus Eisenbacteria bacterium]